MGGVVSLIGQNKLSVAVTVISMALMGYYTMQHRRNMQHISRINRELYQPRVDSDMLDETIIYKGLKAQNNNRIFKVALTGGPCGGKSSALEPIRNYFQQKGFLVLSVPELPTIVSKAGGFVVLKDISQSNLIKFQSDMIKFKLFLEQYLTTIADMYRLPCIMLCDRGLVDFAAYVDTDIDQAIRDEAQWSWTDLRDRRYDAVIFMTSAAVGAPEHYTLKNNQARTETVQQAYALDRKTLNVWIGHPQMTLCRNIKGKPFEAKVKKAISGIRKVIGLKSQFEFIRHKFKIQKPKFPAGQHIVETACEQFHLKNKDPRFELVLIQKRSQYNSSTYYHRKIGHKHPGELYHYWVNDQINALEYANLKEEVIEGQVVRKKSTNFVWDEVYFTVESYRDGTHVLLFQLEADLMPVSFIPPFLQVQEDIGHRYKYLR